MENLSTEIFFVKIQVPDIYIYIYIYEMVSIERT